MSLSNAKNNSPANYQNGNGRKNPKDDATGFKSESSSNFKNESANEIQSVTDQLNEVENGVVSQDQHQLSKSDSLEGEIEKRIMRFTSRLYTS
ncbi:MAG: hypothetical protein KJO64_08710 [Bacteroidia bacterium]|nr:hypothetical protein [Bacteroidia bacterium]NNC85516.1 hypothetical protein [Bacteroidia bacterium]